MCTLALVEHTFCIYVRLETLARKILTLKARVISCSPHNTIFPKAPQIIQDCGSCINFSKKYYTIHALTRVFKINYIQTRTHCGIYLIIKLMLPTYLPNEFVNLIALCYGGCKHIFLNIIRIERRFGNSSFTHLERPTIFNWRDFVHSQKFKDIDALGALTAGCRLARRIKAAKKLKFYLKGPGWDIFIIFQWGVKRKLFACAYPP